MVSVSDYYPSNVTVTPLEHKVYELSWTKGGTHRYMILTKAMCIKFINNINNAKELREALHKAFKEGLIK